MWLRQTGQLCTSQGELIGSVSELYRSSQPVNHILGGHPAALLPYSTHVWKDSRFFRSVVVFLQHKASASWLRLSKEGVLASAKKISLDPQTSTNLWQTLLSSRFCSYTQFFSVVEHFLGKRRKNRAEISSMGFRCFGACSGNKCVFSGSLTNLHMLDAVWHFGGRLQPATSSAISRNSSAIFRNRAQFQKVSAGPLSRGQKRAKISRCSNLKTRCPLCTHVTYWLDGVV